MKNVIHNRGVAWPASMTAAQTLPTLLKPRGRTAQGVAMPSMCCAPVSVQLRGGSGMKYVVDCCSGLLSGEQIRTTKVAASVDHRGFYATNGTFSNCVGLRSCSPPV